MMTLGQRIQNFRRKKGLTQKQLAETLNLATGTIQQYELDKRQPRIKQLQEIAAALNVSTANLLGVEPDEKLDKFIRCFPNAPASIKDGQAVIQIIGYDPKTRVSRAMSKLNKNGQEVAAERIEELTKIPEYQKDISED